MEEFKPKIVGFLCNWCTYAAADMAGATKTKLPSSFNVVRVMCSSRVDHNLLLTTFFNGADGVLVAGWHPGDCHYQVGNFYTRRRFALLKKVFQTLNIDPERFQLTWISASEGNKYGQVVNGFTEKIRKLGPNPLKKDLNL